MNLSMILCVGAGGFIGTVLRYTLALALSTYFTAVIGVATFAVNVIGSFFIAFLYGLGAERLSSEMLTILSVGLLGGFTTYSAFSNETLHFLKEGRIGYASAYVLVMVSVCLFASYLGFLLSRKI